MQPSSPRSGALLFIQATGSLIFGDRQLPFPSDNLLGGDPLNLGSVVVTRPQAATFLAAVILTVGLVLVLRWSRYGLMTQACAQDVQAAELQGVDSRRIIVLTFVIGSMMAGAAGMFWASTYNVLQPDMGFSAGLVGLVAAVLGGIGDIRGSLIGGLVLGLVQSLGVAYIPGASGFGTGFAFAVLIILLWARPEGLLGRRSMARPGAIERPLSVLQRQPPTFGQGLMRRGRR